MPENQPPGLLHAPGQGKFLNTGLMAFNAFEIDIPGDVIESLQPHIAKVRACEENGAHLTLGDNLRLRNCRPEHWHSDICWLSHENEETFAFFDRIFARLGLARTVASLIEHDREIKLYAGFFVTRRSCWALDLHYDWMAPRNQAFTLLAPLTENCADLGMTFENAREDRCDWRYRIGKGLVFGSGFLHSTAVGELAERSVFLSLTFGSDRMDDWPAIARTVGAQCDLLREPDGRFSRRKDRIARGVIPETY